jgi:hypothetical protein
VKAGDLGVVRGPAQELLDLARIRADQVLGGGTERAGQLVQQDRIELVFIVEHEVEVVVPCPCGHDRQAAQQDRSARLQEELVPPGHAASQEANADPALFE